MSRNCAACVTGSKTIVEHPSAAGAKHVPGQIEQPDPRRVQKRRDDALLVQSALGREIHDIDAAEPVIWRVPDEPLDCRHDIGIGRLPQDLEHGLGIAHVENHIEESGLEKPHWREWRIAHSRHRRFLRLRALE
jgi:hypothetical protein